MRENQVILVDNNDQAIGVSDKMEAHRQGLLHRAISVFVFREVAEGHEVLLQQRSSEKYHSAGLWANTCCSHPYPDEVPRDAGERRLLQEMGFQLPLQEAGGFHYRATVSHGLIENEMDHVLYAVSDVGEIPFNPAEVMAVQWVGVVDCLQDLVEHPDQYVVWLAPGLELALAAVLKDRSCCQ